MAVIGASPVSFISEDEVGVVVQIPLSVLTIAHGAVTIAGSWKPPLPGQVFKVGGNDVKLVPALLASLLAQGLISPPPT